jgi:hypothetical protein
LGAQEPRPDPSPSPAASAAPVAAPEQDERSLVDRQAEKVAAAANFPEQQRESVLDLARSILAQSEASPFSEGAGQRAGPPSSVPALDPAVADAIARGKQAFDVERAVEDGFAAFKAEQAQEQMRQEQAREAEAAQQRALAEAEQKLEQERAAERGRSYGMEM